MSHTSLHLIPQFYKVGTIIILILQDHISSRLCSQSLNQGLPADSLRRRFKIPCLELSRYQAHTYHSNLISCPFSLLSSPCSSHIYFNTETSARGCQSLSCLSISAFASASLHLPLHVKLSSLLLSKGGFMSPSDLHYV